MIARSRASIVCVHDHKLLAIELQDPTTRKRFWSVPGGEIEEGESPAQAAARETREETGYEISVDETSRLTNRYLFRWDGKVFDCETHWFRAHLDNRDAAEVDDAAYLLRVKWLPLDRLGELFGYHPAIRDAIARLLPDQGLTQSSSSG